MTQARPIVLFLACLIGAVGLVGCGASDSATAQAGTAVDPGEISLAITTTACGHSSKTTGSGFWGSDGLVITAAHVVIGAGEVSIETATGSVAADVIGLDPQRDLALLRPAGSVRPAAPMADQTAQTGTAVTVLGSTSGRVDTTLGRRLTLRVDDVRAATRSERQGWDLPVTLAAGDSGAPVVDQRGQVVAMIFSGTAARDGRSFAIDAAEVLAFLNEASPGSWTCDPSANRQVPSP